MRKLLLALFAFLLLLPSLYAQQKQADYSAPAEYTIGGITVVGATVLDKNALISISGLAVGQKIKVPGDDITSGLRKLWKQGIIGDVQINGFF